MFKTVNVKIVDNIRQAEYEGSYVVIEDNGDTMVIEVESNLEKQNRADVDYLSIMTGVDL